MDSAPEVHFDGWTLRRSTGELIRGATRIRLQTQPQQVLEALLARPGELVTREELIARLWPKGVVDYDTALNSAVRRLRRALGDIADQPVYVETVPRRGYRYIGTIDPPARRPALAHVASLDDPQAPARESAAHVAHAAARPGWRVRTLVSAALLPMLLAAAALLWPMGRDAGVPPASPDISHAQEPLLRAQHFFQRRAPGDIERARKYFLEAIGIDPGLAAAWAGLAGSYWIDTVNGSMAPEVGLAKVRDAAERALALNPQLAEAHLRMANYRSVTGDPSRRDEHLRRALELEPDNPLVLGFFASIAFQEARPDQAIALQRRAVEAEPLSGVARYNLASMLYMAGRNDDAKAESLRLLELDPLAHQFGDILCQLLVIEGQFLQAVELAGQWPASVERHHCLALAYHGLGRTADAAAELAALTSRENSAYAFYAAEVLAYRGEHDAAFDWLQGATGRINGSPWPPGGRRLPWMMQYSQFLAPLHGDPRWEAWRTAALLPAAQGVPPHMAASPAAR